MNAYSPFTPSANFVRPFPSTTGTTALEILSNDNPFQRRRTANAILWFVEAVFANVRTPSHTELESFFESVLDEATVRIFERMISLVERGVRVHEIKTTKQKEPETWMNETPKHEASSVVRSSHRQSATELRTT
jgi:hypothetical protein